MANSKSSPHKLVVFLGIIWQLVLFIRLPISIWDPGITMAWFTSKGLAFYKDFAGGNYLPLPKLLLIPLTGMFGWDLSLTIYLGLFQALITLYVVYKISLKHISEKAAMVAVLYYSIWFGFVLRQNTYDSSLLIGLLILLMFYVFEKWLSSNNRKHAVLLGFIASIAFFSQQMSIVPISAILIGMAIFYFKRQKNISRVVYEVIAPFVAGFLPVGLGIIYYMVSKGSLYEFFDQTFLYYVQSRYAGSRSNSWIPRDAKILTFMSIPFVSLLVLLIARFKKTISQLLKNDRETWLLTVLTCVLLFTTASFFFAIIHPRRFLMLLPLMCYVAGLVFDRGSKLKSIPKKILVLLLSLFVIYSTTAIFPWYFNSIKKGRKYDICNISQPGDYVNSAVKWVRENTPEDSRIHVLGPMILYYEAQRLPANNRTYSAQPQTYEPFEETKRLFLNQPADYWLVDERQFKRFKEIDFEHQSIFIRQLLDEKYSIVFSEDWMSVYEYK